MSDTKKLSRRDVLKMGAVAGATAAVSSWALPSKTNAAVYIEAFPTSPLILNPFTDPLPVPKAQPRATDFQYDPLNHDSLGGRPHQIIPSQLGLPEPIHYKIPLRIGKKVWTTSPVLPIDADGNPTVSFERTAAGVIQHPAGTQRVLPPSTVTGFNGAFPGARVNAEYGKPVVIRFVNELDQNPENLEMQDFGSPIRHFLTHLHNGHTAPESDGNPNYQDHGYGPGEFSDNLYLNYPAGGDDREKQSFLWFHDHQHSHTGANVYKGMVGLFPIYDPVLDPGDETRAGLHLPGVRTDNPDGTFDVEYDLPLAFYDLRIEDGVTVHMDAHNPNQAVRPEWWGMHFFMHFPNHGFVGDIFTVNCTAFPVYEVKRRKYRLRMLSASIARCYEMMLMSSTGGPVAAKDLGYKGDDLQGQYRLPDGQQCMQMVQIATDGGLIPAPIVRNSCEIWPGKRREFIVDFTKYMNGTPTTKGDVVYLVNVMRMFNGRKPDGFGPAAFPDYKIPMLKFVIGDPPPVPDRSVIPTALRPIVPFPFTNFRTLINNRRVFRLERGSDPLDPENEWLINGRTFDPTVPLAFPKLGSAECWEVSTSGGWTHPMHFHQEEHRVVMRNGKPIVSDPRHIDDVAREDLVALDPGESVVIFRRFRTFTGPYVAHCHNLAHEDHSMMFGWNIVP